MITVKEENVSITKKKSDNCSVLIGLQDFFSTQENLFRQAYSYFINN